MWRLAEAMEVMMQKSTGADSEKGPAISVPAVELAQGQKHGMGYGGAHCRFMNIEELGGPRLGEVPVRWAGILAQRARSLRYGLIVMVVERLVGMEPRWLSAQYQFGPGNAHTLVPWLRCNSSAFSLLSWL